jgi:general secretion pathway protein M
VPPVSDRDRWLALGLLLAALALAYLVLVHPWWTVPMLAENARIDTLQQRELRARMQLSQATQVRQALTRARAQLARSPGFVPESSAELATAGLIKRLETVVGEASPGNRACAISNRSPLNEPSGERYVRVSVQVRLRCGVPETAAVLHALESGAPRLFVDNLNVLAQRYFAMADQAQGQSGGLDVSFDLYGYLRPQPQAPQATRTAPARLPGAAGAR